MRGRDTAVVSLGVRWCLALAGILALATTVRATDDSSPLEPVPVRVESATSAVGDDGEFLLRLACTPETDLGQLFALRVALTTHVDLVRADHVLVPRTSKWKAGERVDCVVRLALPPDGDYEPGELVSVRLGFVADDTNLAQPVSTHDDGVADEDGLVEVLAIEVPRWAGPTGRQDLDELVAEAAARRAERNAVAAWALLENALWEAVDEATKARLRDELYQAGALPPPPLTEVEEGVVAERIRAEKVRYFRLIAGRLYDRGMLHGALRLLEEAGGQLDVSAGEAVIGAVDEADRMRQRVDDVRKRILTELTSDQTRRVDEFVDQLGRTEELFALAGSLAAEGDYAVALALLRKLRRVDGVDRYDRAQERLADLGAEYLAATPSDQLAEVRAALEHPAWARTTTVPSHRFLFIGPEKLVQGLPPQSKLRFDLAYVFQTDLFGRRPNPEGDRITVYFKELWDFGGGVGGGKTIDIGRADPRPRRAVRVDTGLLYHELTHCVDDTLPIHAGFREGLANMGAAFTHEMLDQEADALHSFAANLEAFRKYYLDRDLEYWRIQNYGPSAGFFLHFVDRYSPAKRGHEWASLRRFFREYREAYVRDGREPFVVRSLAHHLVRAFGPAAFDDLVSFGFPLVESDRAILGRELAAFEAFDDIDDFEDHFTDYPNSPLPRDVWLRDLRRAKRRAEFGTDEGWVEELRARLGIVYDWKVIGPFFARRADPGACVFAPEVEIDFAQKPQTWRESRAERTQRFWQDPIPAHVPTDSHKNVTLHPSGWLEFDYRPYGDDQSAIYALTHVTVPQATAALVHVRADDDFVVFVNDRRILSYRGRGRNGSSSQVAWRGPYTEVPDGMRAPVQLRAGRNKVLVKIRNRYGKAGMCLAVSHADGSTLAFTADADEPEPKGLRPPVEEPDWRRVARLDHRNYKSKVQVAVGSFRTRNKAIHGDSTDRGVGWRLFTVRPGFPKDSPSNLLWLKPKQTKGIDALRIDVELAEATPPKLLLTFQGEGEDDGLSGWNLILVPHGNDAVAARLERYDRLVYESDPMTLPEAAEGRLLSLCYWDGWCRVTIDDQVLLDCVSIHPIPGRHHVGLATWGPDPLIRSIELFRGR